MTAGPSTVAIILAGGRGIRYDKQTPKQFELLAGRPLVSYALDSFNNCNQIDTILLVVPPGMIDDAARLVNPDQWDKLSQPFIGGGERRCDSCYQALKALTDYSPDTIVLVHDGARPFISVSLIEKSIAALQDYDGTVPALPVVDSLARVAKKSANQSAKGEAKEGDDFIGDELAPVGRAGMFRLQTPQGFSLKLLRLAYEHFYIKEKGQPEPTDDCSLVLSYAKQARIKVIAGERKNIKLTYPEDFELLKAWS